MQACLTSADLLLLEGHAGRSSPDGLIAATCGHDVESIHSHILKIGHTGEVEPYDYHKVAEQKNGALEIVALSFAVHIA